MANKILQVSDDSGSTWDDIPGPAASISRSAVDIDDSIHGQTFESGERGPISWSVTGNAYYKGAAGYNIDIKKIGSSTDTGSDNGSLLSDESFSQVTGQVYQIDDANKQVWDRSQTITILDGVTDVTDEVETFDYLFGKITFKSSYTVVGAITASALSYFPMASFSRANDATLTMTATAVPENDFITMQANSGYQTHTQGLRTVTLDLEGIHDASEDFGADIETNTELIIEVDPLGDAKTQFRGFFKILGADQDGDVGDVESESVSFTLSVPGTDITPFSWNNEADSTLSSGIEKAITAWIDETDIDVRYLYDGTNGWSGTSVVTEVSLSTSIDSMNEFSLSFQGDGSLTDVP